MTREEKMGETDDKSLAIYTRKNFKKKDKFHHNKKKDIRRRPKDIFKMFDAIVVMKRDTWKEIVPYRKRDTKLIFLKMMNQQTKYSNERRMIQMKSMC